MTRNQSLEVTWAEVLNCTKFLARDHQLNLIFSSYREIWDKRNPDADQHRSHRDLARGISDFLNGNPRYIKLILKHHPEIVSDIESIAGDIMRAIFVLRQIDGS